MTNLGCCLLVTLPCSKPVRQKSRKSGAKDSSVGSGATGSGEWEPDRDEHQHYQETTAPGDIGVDGVTMKKERVDELVRAFEDGTRVDVRRDPRRAWRCCCAVRVREGCR